jgi:hypothetical protein
VDPQTEVDVAKIELAAAEAHATATRLEELAAQMRLRARQAKRKS